MNSGDRMVSKVVGKLPAGWMGSGERDKAVRPYGPGERRSIPSTLKVFKVVPLPLIRLGLHEAAHRPRGELPHPLIVWVVRLDEVHRPGHTLVVDVVQQNHAVDPEEQVGVEEVDESVVERVPPIDEDEVKHRPIRSLVYFCRPSRTRLERTVDDSPLTGVDLSEQPRHALVAAFL
eukprot:scaffold754_cov248-Pinguiococcus_pyrenoidosus.AAC.16